MGKAVSFLAPPPSGGGAPYNKTDRQIALPACLLSYGAKGRTDYRYIYLFLLK